MSLQSAKHEKHSENPSWNKTCIDSNISLNFEPNKQQNKYKRFIIVEIIKRNFAEDKMNWSTLSQNIHNTNTRNWLLKTDTATNKTKQLNSETCIRNKQPKLVQRANAFIWPFPGQIECDYCLSI